MRLGRLESMILAIFCGLAFVLISTQSPPLPYYHNGNLDLKETVRYWQTRITRIGPARAHDEMVRAGERIPQQHILAHAFGDALFETGDLSAIKYCGAGEYVYGCYHQFLGLAASHFGIESLGALRNVCAETTSAESCAHGIGHGLLSAHGAYSSTTLGAALRDCTSIYGAQEDANNCAEGVFMEYNLQEMTTFYEGSNGPIVRTLDLKLPYGPCDTVTTFKTQCIYQLPLWWAFSLQISKKNIGDRTSQMIRLCSSLHNLHDRRVCWLGVGYPISRLESFSAEGIIDACTAGASGDARVSCLAGAARRYFEAGYGTASTCADLGLSGDGLSYCKKAVNVPRSVMFELEIK